ncbi:MAG: alkaline phosphatase [Thermodesulfobacteriota bacterium]|nr:alkaline phosphatase [Thermodesulfobacteriota bacterium]
MSGALNFDYFGGGGFHDDESGEGNAVETAKANGFTFAYTRSQLEGVHPGTRTIAMNHTLDSSLALYYELDRPEDHLSLAEFTKQGIRILDNDKGFFMMVEGGKIDWACHANDARAAIDDTIAFDDAVCGAGGSPPATPFIPDLFLPHNRVNFSVRYFFI